MEVEQEEVLEPMSPTAQFLNSSVFSLMTIHAVLEFEVPLNDSVMIPWIKDVFLAINPVFSSIPVTTTEGVKKWKKVEVNLKEHVNVPIFPTDMSIDYYDECFTEYLSKLTMEPLSQNRPLWEIHIVKYPTKTAAGNIIFKLHHSLGDGYSLMGALLSCTQRVDNPLMPLTFPSRQSNMSPSYNNTLFGRVPRFFKGLAYTAYDFGWSFFKSNLIKDDKSPIRSGVDGGEFRRIVTSTTTFSIDQIKQIKGRLNVTINDVITGIIMLGTRLYMQEKSPGSEEAKSKALVVVSTRAIGGYKSVYEMTKPDSEVPWGNRASYIQVPLPKLTATEQQNPLIFVKEARGIIKRQRNSAVVYFTGQLLNVIGKIGGPQATARYLHWVLNNTSMTISNMIGPMEQMSLANQPANGLYFVVGGFPQSLQVTMLSYMGKLRIAMSVEKGFMDPNKFKSCLEYAFEIISKAALESSDHSF